MTVLTLHGCRYSVYHRIVRMCLAEKGVRYDVEEVDPFSPPLPADYARRHPFGRVPVLSHGETDIYETAAITRYIDAAFPGPGLTPPSALGQTRMAQVIGIIDSYGYVPLVRQVFAHAVFRPAEGLPGDPDIIAEGLRDAITVLGALEDIAAEGVVLNTDTLTLADCHLAPMIAYFTATVDGQAMLDGHPALSPWWDWISVRDSLIQTDPGLPND